MFKNILVGISLLFLSQTVLSQDFEVAPVVINFNANPGEIQQTTITIRNHSNIKQAYTFNMGDFEIQADGTKKRMAAGKSDRSCAHWLTVTPSFLEMNPNEEREVKVLITVPSGENASKWCYIYAQATSEQKENPVDKQLATGILITPRIAILVNQSPKSNMNYKGAIGKLKDITEPTDSLYSYSVDVTNTGDKIIEAKVQLTIANMETYKETKFEKDMQRVYPGETRNFVLTMPKTSGKGKHAVAAILDYGHGTNLEGTQILVDLK